MECTLATLIACFSWANLYIDGGLSYQDRGDTHVVSNLEQFERRLPNGVIESGTEMVTRVYDVRYNPYGRLALGYQLDFGSLVLSIEGAHRSSLKSDDDRGINSVQLRARWFPFR